jgi:uroporphyrinogen-III decarboxylase
LIQDPSGYFTHVYLPRVFGALGGFPMLPFLPGILEIYGLPLFFIPFGLPPVQATYKALFEAGAEALKWVMPIGGADGMLATHGFPTVLGGFTKAPFDVIGDTLRGTKGLMLDIYRRPDKLIEAMEALVPLMIGMGIANARQTGNPLIFIPLHKGADGFISDEQFKKFFWPTLRKVILGLIEEGIVPLPALEGYWNTRLEVIQDVPKGKSVWMVDQSDMVKVKNTLGQNACLLGNVPSSMLNLGTPQDVKDYVKNLIDTVGKDGGLIICNGAFFDEAKPENVRAIVEATKEYGTYK